MADLPGYDEALRRALAIVTPLDVVEEVDLAGAADRVLAEAIIADRDLPPFNRAMMDGYALRASDLNAGAKLPVVADIVAGAPAAIRVATGECVKIATGAPVPVELDAVIQHELSDRRNPVSFTIDAVEPGHAIHPRGADARASDELIAAGTNLKGQHLGIAAAVGRSRLRVYRKPRVTILTSGDEVRQIDESVESHQIRNSNGPMLVDLLRRFGAQVIRHDHLPDQKETTLRAVRTAIDVSDLVLTVGGVSAGERDYFPAAFQSCRVEMAVSGAAIQPGRPIHVGRTPDGTIICGLPGNPVSVLATAHLFVWPIVRRIQGSNESLPWTDRLLAEPVKPNPKRQAFRPARLNDDGTITVPQWAGSGDLAHTAFTHGLAALPVQTKEVPVNAAVPFLKWA